MTLFFCLLVSDCLVGGDTDLKLFLPGVFKLRQGLEKAMAAASGLFSYGSRVQRIQFIGDESSRRNTGQHLEKGGYFGFSEQMQKAAGTQWTFWPV